MEQQLDNDVIALLLSLLAQWTIPVCDPTGSSIYVENGVTKDYDNLRRFLEKARDQLLAIRNNREEMENG